MTDVVGVGDEIRGRGVLVRTPDGIWFDPPLPVPLVFPRPTPTPSRFAIPVEGADIDAVAHRYERDGAVTGGMAFHGRWLGDRILVHRQTDEMPPPRPLPNWSDPPCPAPPGGWPRHRPDDEPVDFDDLRLTGAVVSIVIFRPSPEQEVVVVAASDVAAVEARLRPQLRDRFCVVPSRWTRRQVDDALGYLRSCRGVYESGESCDEQAQVTVYAKLVRVTDEIKDWVEAQPAGLVDLAPCLIPVQR